LQLNDPGQIGNEFAAHNQYVACAVYYDAETMPQMAASSTARRSRSATTR
jgi:ferritin